MYTKIASGFLKISFFATVLTSVVSAQMINGIALIVNGEPVTLYDVQKTVQTLKVDRQKAIDLLIDQKIVENAIKEYGITVSDREIEEALFQKAIRYDMSKFEFESYLTSQNVNLDEYKKDLEKVLKKDKLFGSLVSQSIKEPTDKDLLHYYQTHQELYAIPNSIDVVRYDASNQGLLASFIKTPLILKDGITKTPQTLHKKDLNADFWMMLSQTDEKSFTQIIPNKDKFSSFFISQKKDIDKLSFGKAKSMVKARYFKDQERRIIDDFYKKRRANAEVKVIAGT